jgi:methionine-rich copper-binding protein CopC
MNNGAAPSNFSIGTAANVANVSATVDQTTVNTSITINPPTVASVDPVNGAVNVPIYKVIKITFSEPIQYGSASNQITVKNSTGTAISLNPFLISGNVLTLSPVNSYLTGNYYTINIPANAVNDLAGNGLATDYTSGFKVTPLSITNIDPINGATNVPINKVITVTFSEAVMPGNNYANISVTNINTGELIAITKNIPYLIHIGVGGKITYIWSHILEISCRSGNFTPSDTYIIKIPINAVQDTAGNGLLPSYPNPTIDYHSRFTVSPLAVNSTDPVNNTVNVPNNKVIKVTFSEPITAGSDYSSITVKNSGGVVKMMNASINGSVLTLTPVYNYLIGYNYTLTLPVNSVKDLVGNNLASAYISNFTIATIIPSVNGTDPVNGAVSVTNNKVIKITFSEPITAGSAYKQITVKNSAGALKTMNTSISGSVLTLTPVYNYLTGYKYTITIPANAIKDATGNGLTSDFTSGFTIATTILSVNSTDPVNGSVNVANTKVIKITFSEPITAGSTYNQITVKNSAGAVKTMNASISGSVLTLTPVYNYLTGYKYTITIPANAIKDSKGNGLSTDYISSFTTTTT